MFEIYSFFSNKLFLIIYSIIFLISFPVCVHSIHNIRKKRFYSENSGLSILNSYPKTFNILFCIALFVSILSYATFYNLLGADDIRLLPNGTYSYYVLLETDTKKEYTLPAKIYVYTEEESRDDGDPNYLNGESDTTGYRYNKQIYLANVYFKNGGYLYFEDGEIQLNKKMFVTDYKGNEYECTLLNEHIDNVKVEETQKVSFESTFYMISSFVAILAAWIFFIVYRMKIKDSKKKETNME